jgi:hypothetical protein
MISIPTWNLYVFGFIVFWVGWFMSSQVKFFNGMKRVQKARDEKYGELKKIYDLTNSKMRTSVSELDDLVNWVNEELPKDLTLDIISDPNLTVLKNKGGIPDKDYIEAFEDVILHAQQTVAIRIQKALDSINRQLINDIKGLMSNDTIQEK